MTRPILLLFILIICLITGCNTNKQTDKSKVTNNEIPDISDANTNNQTNVSKINNEEVFDASTVNNNVEDNEVAFYMEYFLSDYGSNILLGIAQNEGISDAAMSAYVYEKLVELNNYHNIENGNTKIEYNEIAQKYFGKDITNFNNGVIEEIIGTERIGPIGWDCHNTPLMILDSIKEEENGIYVGNFYYMTLYDSYDEIDKFTKAKEQLLNGEIDSFIENVSDSLLQITFEKKTDENSNLYLVYYDIKRLENEVLNKKGKNNLIKVVQDKIDIIVEVLNNRTGDNLIPTVQGSSNIIVESNTLTLDDILGSWEIDKAVNPYTGEGISLTNFYGTGIRYGGGVWFREDGTTVESVGITDGEELKGNFTYKIYGNHIKVYYNGQKIRAYEYIEDTDGTKYIRRYYDGYDGEEVRYEYFKRSEENKVEDSLNIELKTREFEEGD